MSSSCRRLAWLRLRLALVWVPAPVLTEGVAPMAARMC